MVHGSSNPFHSLKISFFVHSEGTWAFDSYTGSVGTAGKWQPYAKRKLCVELPKLLTLFVNLCTHIL